MNADNKESSEEIFQGTLKMPASQFMRRRVQSIKRLLKVHPVIVITRLGKPVFVVMRPTDWAHTQLRLESYRQRKAELEKNPPPSEQDPIGP